MIEHREDHQPLPAERRKALAIGALAIGALAIGRLGIGKFAVRHGQFGTLDVDELTVKWQRVAELLVEPEDGVGTQ